MLEVTRTAVSRLALFGLTGVDKLILLKDIGMLATAPEHQHNGAGTMLLKAVLAEADEIGVPVYLEGTDTAKAFYKKHGFETVTDLNFDPSDYGVEGLGTEHQTAMVRAARVKPEF